MKDFPRIRVRCPKLENYSKSSREEILKVISLDFSSLQNHRMGFYNRHKVVNKPNVRNNSILCEHHHSIATYNDLENFESVQFMDTIHED